MALSPRGRVIGGSIALVLIVAYLAAVLVLRYQPYTPWKPSTDIVPPVRALLGTWVARDDTSHRLVFTREVLRQVTPESTYTAPWRLKALQADGTAMPGQFTIAWGREPLIRYSLCTIRYGMISVELEWDGVWYRKTRF